MKLRSSLPLIRRNHIGGPGIVVSVAEEVGSCLDKNLQR